jgi:hypothetical protein
MRLIVLTLYRKEPDKYPERCVTLNRDEIIAVADAIDPVNGSIVWMKGNNEPFEVVETQSDITFYLYHQRWRD